jgi:hypothetical protein
MTYKKGYPMMVRVLFIVGLIVATSSGAEQNSGKNIYLDAPGKIAVHLNNISRDKRVGFYYQQQKALLKSDNLSFNDRMTASQFTATYASFIGDYRFAIEEFDRYGTQYRDIPDERLFNILCQPVRVYKSI